MNQKNNHPSADRDSLWNCLKGSISDRVLLLSILLACAWLWWTIYTQLNAGQPMAYIYHQQQLLAKYPLPTDDTIIRVPATGEIGVSDIEISRQGIRFVSSPCTTHHCTLAGHKNHAGAVIACVPNHIMAVIRGSVHHAAMPEFDGITE